VALTETASGERADSTHARLVQAAAEVFAEKGYDKAGVAEIARRAGLTTGAIYSRFSGKAELLAEAIRHCGGDEFDALFAQHGFDGRAADILLTVASHLVTREANPVRSLLLEAFVASRRDPEVQAVVREHLLARAAQLSGVIELGKQHGLVDDQLDTAALVHFAHAVGLGFLLYEALDVPSPDPAQWMAIVARMVGATAPAPDPSRPDPPSPGTPEEH
jgi:AcrR family transcriptional regulator